MVKKQCEEPECYYDYETALRALHLHVDATHPLETSEK